LYDNRFLTRFFVVRLRRQKDAGLSALTFPLDADPGVLIRHSKSGHPLACERLMKKSDAELARLQEQVERTDSQLLDAMDVDHDA
jgi:hypothetical protein